MAGFHHPPHGQAVAFQDMSWPCPTQYASGTINGLDTGDDKNARVHDLIAHLNGALGRADDFV